jgi:lipopolysaccharide assembly protein A
MRVLHWLGILVAAVLGGTFAISNRDVVSLAFWPVPFVVTLPLYLLVFAALLAGFVAGAIAVWVGGRRRRRQLRSSRRRIGALESELATARSRSGDNEIPPKPSL